ncbi:hypothetical protein T459_09463 [Capsicum annuum]|uniref:Uncharacterized protein n=1 Tax=Capsicum annuum TaxID=4072 RepID=A0A2G2ZZG0_CAPAN|nr:hypothetical protein T459_09463 [Capsicum annuum]
MPVFYGRKVISELKREFIIKVWASIRTKLESLTADRVYSLADEIQVVLKGVSGMGVDISPLQNLLESFFELATFYDQARSILVDKAKEIEKSESYIKVKEHLELVMKERDEKYEELSAACQSLEKAIKKVKKLKSLQDVAKEEVRKIESKVSAAEKEFNKCADISLATQNASNDVDQKKQVLEDSLQDLVNYKLCLD